MRDDLFSGRLLRTGTVKVRTALSRPCSESFFLKSVQNPDSGQNRDRKMRTNRHRTAFFTKFRTESGQHRDRQNPDRQTDIGQRIRTESVQRTESRQQTYTGHDFLEIPDKHETRTGQGRCCSPTSVFRDDWLECEKAYCPDIKEDRSI